MANNNLKKVQAEAKKLKAKNKNLTHVQALKQAWAIVLHKAPKKKVGTTKQITLFDSAPAKKVSVKSKTKKIVPVKAYDRKANHVPATKRTLSGIEKKNYDSILKDLKLLNSYAETVGTFKNGQGNSLNIAIDAQSKYLKMYYKLFPKFDYKAIETKEFIKDKPVLVSLLNSATAKFNSWKL